MPKITGLKELQRTLKQLKSKSKRRDDGSVIVGYTANYALWVHEAPMIWRGRRREGKRPDGSQRKGRYWDPQGRAQSKFLEQPARTMQKELAAIIAKTTNKIGLIKALLIAGLRLQRESQKLVPVDSGNLKSSAFTALDKGGNVQIAQGPTNL